jgi:uncharacterized protein YggE
MRAAVLPVVVAVCLAVPFGTAVAAEAEPRTVSTTGEAVVYVVPDEVVVGFGVESFKVDLDAAKQLNDDTCARLLKAIREAGVEEKHIQTDTMTVEIAYRDGSHPTRGIEGYFARRAYSVTLKDVKRFEPLVATALKNGANRIHGFEFKTTELRKHRDEARKRAIRAAKEKAEALAAELGAKAGKPRSIGEGYSGGGSYRSWWGWGGNYQANAQVAVQGDGGGEGGETMPLGQIAVRAQVSVTFDLEP